MNSDPLVSVIIPFLNAEKYIGESLESVVAQSYEQWELLLVDDGSTDKSTEIARTYAGKFPKRVTYLDHPGHQNLGTSVSRNLGIRHSRGEFICFLDADDIYLPGKLENQTAILQAHPTAGFVCGRNTKWYSWTGNQDDVDRDVLQRLDVPLDTVIRPPALLVLYVRDESATPQDTLIRRTAIEAVDGWEETFRGMHDDQAFYAKLSLFHDVFVSSECSYWYRRHPESMCQMTVATGRYAIVRDRFLKWLKHYLAEKNIRSQELLDVLENELRTVRRLRHPMVSHGLVKVEGILRRAGRRVVPSRIRAWLRTL